MSRIERLLGVLAGALGVAALIMALTQHVVVVGHGTVFPHTVTRPAGSIVIYGPAINSASALTIIITMGLASLASVLTGVSAWEDTRRGTRRGAWVIMVIVTSFLCLVGLFLMATNSLWVTIGGSPPDFVDGYSVNAVLLFMPAAVAGVVAAALALL